MHLRCRPIHFLGQAAAARKDGHIRRRWNGALSFSDTDPTQRRAAGSGREGTAFDLRAREPRDRTRASVTPHLRLC